MEEKAVRFLLTPIDTESRPSSQSPSSHGHTALSLSPHARSSPHPETISSESLRSCLNSPEEEPSSLDSILNSRSQDFKDGRPSKDTASAKFLVQDDQTRLHEEEQYGQPQHTQADIPIPSIEDDETQEDAQVLEAAAILMKMRDDSRRLEAAQALLDLASESYERNPEVPFNDLKGDLFGMSMDDTDEERDQDRDATTSDLEPSLETPAVEADVLANLPKVVELCPPPPRRPSVVRSSMPVKDAHLEKKLSYEPSTVDSSPPRPSKRVKRAPGDRETGSIQGQKRSYIFKHFRPRPPKTPFSD